MFKYYVIILFKSITDPTKVYNVRKEFKAKNYRLASAKAEHLFGTCKNITGHYKNDYSWGVVYE